MAEFYPGKPVRSLEPMIRVDNIREPGTYRFRLVVIDDERNVSEPSELLVHIAEYRYPYPYPYPVDR